MGFFLYGFGFGGTIPISEFIWARYFGRGHIGAIRGISNPVSIVGTGIGPVLVGAWFDISGAYGAAFLAVIGAYIAGALVIGVRERREISLSRPTMSRRSGGSRNPRLRRLQHSSFKTTPNPGSSDGSM